MATPKHTPLKVAPQMGEWWVLTGSRTSADRTFDTKSEAVSYAESKAEREKRPGVVVQKKKKSTPFNKNPHGSTYQKFIPNDAYWKRGYWEA